MTDQHFYDVVAAELERGHLDRGVWTKAFADANGDDGRARAMYIRARVAQLQQESLAAARREQANRDVERRREQAKRDIERRIAMIEGLPSMLLGFALFLIALLAIWFLWLKG